MSLNDRLHEALKAREAAGLKRQRHTLNSAQHSIIDLAGQRLTNFCSNDYLGLANHPALVAALQHASSQYGVGSGASHLVVGHHELHDQLEQRFARLMGYPKALLFGCGYMANLAVVSCLAKRGDLVLQDKLNHASLLDAGQLSSATSKRYAHGDIPSLTRRLQTELAPSAERFIVTDGVFSMDGDVAPLGEIIQVIQHSPQSATLIVDDAHGFGVLGEHGLGTLEHFALNASQVDIVIVTLGKALGAAGAIVLASETVIEYLTQFARPYIYTTAQPPANSAAVLAALDVMAAEPERRRHVMALIEQFRQGLGEWAHLLMPSQTPIQPLCVKDVAIAVALSQKLRAAGFLVAAIRPPTVPEGSARLRFTFTANHTPEQVDQLLRVLVPQLEVLLRKPEETS